MVGKMTGTCAFTTIGLYFSELLPTEVRSQGLGLLMAASQCGGIFASYIISVFVSQQLLHHVLTTSISYLLLPGKI